MPKKRITRKHKISIDQKRQAVHETSASTVVPPSMSAQVNQQTDAASGMTFSLPTNLSKIPAAPKRSVETTAITTENYGYLANDLIRTAILSGAIVIAEIIIRLVYIH